MNEQEEARSSQQIGDELILSVGAGPETIQVARAKRKESALRCRDNSG